MRVFVFLPFLVMSLNTLRSQNLEGTPVNVDYSYHIKTIRYCEFSEFKIFEDTGINDYFIDKLKKKYLKASFYDESPDHTKPFLLIKSMFKFQFKGGMLAVISYLDSKTKEKKTFSPDKSVYLGDLLKEVSKLENDIFWQFYNSYNDIRYPEINKLKPLIKDAKGVLDIEKFAEVLKANKETLAKYFKH